MSSHRAQPLTRGGLTHVGADGAGAEAAAGGQPARTNRTTVPARDRIYY